MAPLGRPAGKQSCTLDIYLSTTCDAEAQEGESGSRDEASTSCDPGSKYLAFERAQQRRVWTGYAENCGTWVAALSAVVLVLSLQDTCSPAHTTIDIPLVLYYLTVSMVSLKFCSSTTTGMGYVGRSLLLCSDFFGWLCRRLLVRLRRQPQSSWLHLRKWVCSRVL